MPTLANLRKELKSKANPKKAKILRRFFKTGPGEYGEGDIFLGIRTPDKRKIAKKYRNLGFGDLGQLLKSKIHDERQTALFILIHQFQGAMLKHSASVRHKIFNLYLKNTKYINNWDLVDLSAPKIVGEYLLEKAKTIRYKLLRQLAESRNIWERRIAILSTYAFIRKNKFEEILKISEMLLNDKHDLIHKAVGWMLREVGKRSLETEEKFLKKHASKMPRVMLRYAIERLPEGKSDRSRTPTRVGEGKRRGYLRVSCQDKENFINRVFRYE